MHPFRIGHVCHGCPNPVSDPVPEPDPELLRRAQRGDETAFGVVMRAHYERTFRLACAIVHNEADARDICQEAWLTVWKQLSTFRGDSRFSTWLHPIVTRRALDHLRKRRRWFDRFLPFETNGDSAASVPEPVTTEDARGQAETNETVMRVRAALATLPPKHRAVLALRELEGLSYEEIAEATGIPAGTVMSRLFHARRLLAEKLGKSSTDQ
jgi:RNA polymerase sigma-70 factor (ECF subfamily)